MSEKIQIAKGLKVKWTGIFDFNDLYRKMKFWLEWSGYGNEKDLEKMYVERIKPGGKQIEIKWVAENEFSGFCNGVIEVTFFAIGIEGIQIEKEGKQIKTKKGDIEIRFSAHLELDVKDKFFDKIYKKYILKNEIEGYKIDLYDDIMGFHDEVKAYLTMQQF
jgi:hypothetical protein